MEDVLLTDAEAQALIGCARQKMMEWIDEGKLWAINIQTQSASRTCWRIGKASALAMRRAFMRGAGIQGIRKPGQKPLVT